MRSATTAQHARLLDARPLALIDEPAVARSIVEQLEAGGTELHPVGEAVFSARLDVPKGEWLLWTHPHAALWIGASASALPSSVRRPNAPSAAHGVAAILERLSMAGIWVREAALLRDGRWSPAQRAERLPSLLAEDTPPLALVGVFCDRRARSARMQVNDTGVVFSDRPELAIEWLLDIAGLSPPT
jgi:hypothetical protein